MERQGGTDGGPLVELLMLSCRVEGRGIPAALLRRLLEEAQGEGHAVLDALYRVLYANAPASESLWAAITGRGVGSTPS